ncbi:ATPase [Sandaracinomonas limnophila]|uniref:ATPase n=1 Tax=Sandaracinomonas limnophila TaxID=1862386 RepID=A0A437PWA4_9BACT|nr:START-like domain-containing protein [Sandaracinomonas limnophila]RVU26533.1 ATPase [Sandaracinomonas limnophila]
MASEAYQFEFEIKASPKVLYPYLSTASGLQQWFADKVTVKNATQFNLIWDNESHLANLVSSKLNKFVKFEFDGGGDSKRILDMSLNVSEVSNTTYLQIIDSASKFKSDEDAEELWEFLTEKLKEIVGS